MPTQIKVPELGESVVEATVAHWLKKVGDPVSVGEPLVELETDKVDLEVGAAQNGVLAKILVEEGQDVQVGDELGVIEDAGEAAAPPAKTSAAATDSQPQAEVKPAAAEKKEAAPAVEPSAPKLLGTDAQPRENSAERITPVARRFAEQMGVNPENIQGTGPAERVTKEDVERYLAQQSQPKPAETQPAEKPKPAANPAVSPPAQAMPDGSRREERIRMTRRRRTIAQRLVEAQQTAAMLTTFNDIDMSAVMELRKRKKEAFLERYQVKLGFMSFFVKAVIAALKDFPHLNAEIQGEEIVLKHYYDIGIAIGAEEGLVVPVLRDADRLSFAAIEKGILDYATKVREGTLSINDLRGGTFTITNGGVFGSLLSTPILNPPQVAILGMHRIDDRPVAMNGQVVIRPMMYVALSYDHRIVDGREAVQFLARLKELLEDPASMLVEA